MLTSGASFGRPLHLGVRLADPARRQRQHLRHEPALRRHQPPQPRHGRGLGHAVGLHAVYPRADLDARFDPVIAWHNPDPEYMKVPLAGAVNVMQEGYFDPATYRSDSNQRWRSGCPHAELAAGAFPWLQLLTHPEIWAFEGATMRASMESFLDADRAARLEHLRDDRIDLS